MSGGSIRTIVGRSALSSAVVSVAIIIIGLVSGWEAAEWLPLVAGLWVGLFLVWGTFRLFGWGRATAEAIFWGGFVGGMIVGVLFVVGSLLLDVSLTTPAVTITFYTVLGLVLGAVGTAAEIGKRLPDENHSR